VTFDDRLVWVYDEPLGVLLKYMIDILVERGLDHSDAWQPKLNQWRATAALGGNVGLELDSYEQNWQPDEYPVFCALVGEASDRAVDAGPIPVDEGARWQVLDALPPVIRSAVLIDTSPCAVIGDALTGLVTGASCIRAA
jgi:hypothetical protein